MLVPRVHKGVISAVDYAKSLHANVRGLHVALDRKTVPATSGLWEEHCPDVPLVVIDSPFDHSSNLLLTISTRCWTKSPSGL